MDCSPPGSSVHGLLQARVLTGMGCHSFLQRSNLDPPALQTDSLPHEPPGKLLKRILLVDWMWGRERRKSRVTLKFWPEQLLKSHCQLLSWGRLIECLGWYNKELSFGQVEILWKNTDVCMPCANKIFLSLDCFSVIGSCSYVNLLLASKSP